MPGALSAARTTNFDFTPYESPVRSYLDAGGTLVTYESGCTEVLVTDAYTLTNPTDQPVTVIPPGFADAPRAKPPSGS